MKSHFVTIGIAMLVFAVCGSRSEAAHSIFACAGPSVTKPCTVATPFTIARAAPDPELHGRTDRTDASTRPIRELSQIGWMAGTWSAQSAEARSSGARRDRGVTTYVFGPTMKGRYFFGADGKEQDYIFITYDSSAKHWVLIRFARNPSYGIWLSKAGWKHNRLEFFNGFSNANGRWHRRRLTISYKGPGRFGIYDEKRLANGTWTSEEAVELTKEK